MTPTAKRSLFSTPGTASKRARVTVTKVTTTRRVRKSKRNKKVPASVKRSTGAHIPGGAYQTKWETPATGLPQAIQMGVLNGSTFPWPTNAERGVKLFSRIKALKVRRQFFYDGNLGSGTDVGPIKIRWFLVQMKAFAGGTSGRTADALNAMVTEFFYQRNQVGQARTFRSFTPYIAGADNWRDELNYLPINPDGAVNIIARKTFTLTARGERSNGAVNGRGIGTPSMKVIHKTFPINKVMAWAGDTNIEPDEMFYEVFFYNLTNPIVFPTANPLASVYIRSCVANGVEYKEAS